MIASTILLLHVGFVAVLLGGVVLIAAGAILDWRWTRRRSLRTGHFACALFVALRTWLGEPCPMTVLERLVGRAPGADSSLEQWAEAAVFRDLSPGLFSAGVALTLILTLALWLVSPPWRSRTVAFRARIQAQVDEGRAS